MHRIYNLVKFELNKINFVFEYKILLKNTLRKDELKMSI